MTNWPPSHTLRLARLAHPGRDWQPMPLEPLMAIRSDPGLPHGVLVYFNADSLDDLARAIQRVHEASLGWLFLIVLTNLSYSDGGGMTLGVLRADNQRRALIAVLDAHPEIETHAPLNGEDHED